MTTGTSGSSGNPYLSEALSQISIGDFIKHEDNYGIITNITNSGIITDNKNNEYDMEEWPTIIKYCKDDTQHDLLLKGLKADMEHLVFRIQGSTSTKMGYNNLPFFYGFTGKENLMHLEQVTPNHPEIYPTVLYYQAGSYSILRLSEGKFEFKEEIQNRMHSCPNAIQAGVVVYNDGKPRYHKWIYTGQYPHCPLYYLYMLIVFGIDYYVIRGMTKEQIISRLYCKQDSKDPRDIRLSESDKHLYQAYAHVVYYDEDIPESYKLPDLKQKIIDNYAWISELHKLGQDSEMRKRGFHQLQNRIE